MSMQASSLELPFYSTFASHCTVLQQEVLLERALPMSCIFRALCIATGPCVRDIGAATHPNTDCAVYIVCACS